MLGVAAGLLGEAVAETDGRGVLVRERGEGGLGAMLAGPVDETGGAMLTTGTGGPAGLVVVLRTTRPAPNQARHTAAAVPPSQAAKAVSTRAMSAIMPHARLMVRTVPVMARVLIVEDDPQVRLAMVADLTRRAHAVRTAGTALDGIREISQHPPEIIVLDLGLPDLDGHNALKMMRVVTETPVIVATARDEEAEIIRLLNAGADDYLVKPFSGEHLAARIAAQLRRSGSGSAAPVVTVGGLRIDLARREAVLEGTAVELSRREFDLLAYLAARPGVVVPRQELLTEVWHQSYGDDQTIDVHVSWLRAGQVDGELPRLARLGAGDGALERRPAGGDREHRLDGGAGQLRGRERAVAGDVTHDDRERDQERDRDHRGDGGGDERERPSHGWSLSSSGHCGGSSITPMPRTVRRYRGRAAVSPSLRRSHDTCTSMVWSSP